MEIYKDSMAELGRRAEQTRKKLITKIVWINCHAQLPHKVCIVDRKSGFRASIHGLWFLVTNKKSHHPLTYCNFYSELHFYGRFEDFLVKFRDNSRVEWSSSASYRIAVSSECGSWGRQTLLKFVSSCIFLSSGKLFFFSCNRPFVWWGRFALHFTLDSS